MKERGILFSAPMVRAILAGTKSQTRRLIKPQPPSVEAVYTKAGIDFGVFTDHHAQPGQFRVFGPVWAVRELMGIEPGWRSPYGVPGDLLWLREAWGLVSYTDPTRWRRGSIAFASEAGILDAWQLTYRADWGSNQESCFWRPSLLMPRWASRITLEVTEVRVQRLQDITEEDARAEGVRACERCDGSGVDPVRVDGGDPEWCATCGGGSQGTTCRDAFARLWDEINGAQAPWSSNPWVWVISFRRLETTK